MDLAWDSSGRKTTLKMHFTPEIIAKFCARPREMFGFFRLFLSFSFLVPKAGKCVKNTKSSSPHPWGNYWVSLPGQSFFWERLRNLVKMGLISLNYSSAETWCLFHRKSLDSLIAWKDLSFHCRKLVLCSVILFSYFQGTTEILTL